jgi:tetratricopeptide (TPR) repeat protein
LKVELLGAHTASAAPGGNAEAYNLCLQGKYFVGRRSPENLEKAISYYERALKLDGAYARAWAGLATAHSNQAAEGVLAPEDAYRQARAEVARALELDPNLAEAHATLGWIRRTYDWDWSGADTALKRARELEPGNATVLRAAATLAGTLGRFEEAVTLDRRAVEIDPLSVRTHVNLALHALRPGLLDEAEAALRRARELNPEYPSLHLVFGRVFLERAMPQAALQEMEREKDPFWRRQGLALAYHALGRKKEANAALAELLANHKEDSFQIAEVFAFRGEADKAFEWLEQAYAQRDGGLADVKDPLFKSLERDPRYRAFLEKMRLPL